MTDLLSLHTLTAAAASPDLISSELFRIHLYNHGISCLA
jgi:hypothetical protein